MTLTSDGPTTHGPTTHGPTSDGPTNDGPTRSAAMTPLQRMVTKTANGTLADGPWQAAFWFSVPGTVRSKSNYRHKGATKWSAIQDFEESVWVEARAARPAGWDLGDSAADLASRPRVLCALLARTTLDAGNLSKSVLDACEGVLFTTDASVTFCAEVVERATRDPGLLAAFALLPAASTTLQTLTAGAALQGAVSRAVQIA